MAIDWTAIALPPALSGSAEYRVEDDGLVRWRGLMTVVVVGGSFVLPVEAWPLQNPLYLDWTAVPGDDSLLVTGGTFYLPYTPVGQVVNLSHTVWKGTPPPPVVRAHTLPNVFSGIATALDTIPGLRVYSYPSEKIETPAGVLSLPQTPYDVTLGGRADQWTFPIWVLVSKANDKAAHNEMLPYLDSEGERSIRAAIELDRTLGGACDTAAVINAQPQIVSVGGTEFLAVEFTLEVFS